MSETKTLYLDLVPTSQEHLTAAVERLEGIGLAAAGAVRHLVDPYLDAFGATRKYLGVDHTQVVDATVGYAGRLAEQQRQFLTELGDALLGKSPARHGGAKPRSSAAA
jgi:hypothetical protein